MDAAHHVRPRQREEVVVPLEGQRVVREALAAEVGLLQRWPWIIVPGGPVEDEDPLGRAGGPGSRGRRRSRRPSRARRGRLPLRRALPEEVARDQRTGQDAGQHERHRRVPEGLVVERHGDDPEDRRQQADRDQPDGLLRARGEAAQPSPSPLALPGAGHHEGRVVPAEAERGRDRHPQVGRPAALATWSTPAHSGSTSRRLMVGGTTPSCRARAVIAASNAPVAPMQCPCIDLVPLTATREAASSPSASLSTRSSVGSPDLLAAAVGVDVVDVLRRHRRRPRARRPPRAPGARPSGRGR